MIDKLEMLDELLIRLRIFMETEVYLFSLNDLSHDVVRMLPSSWSFLTDSKLDYKEKIIYLWKPAKEDGQLIGNILVQNCEEILLLFAPETTFSVRICYLYYRPSGLHCWTGNTPSTKDDHFINISNSVIQLPTSYQLMSRVHNGFNSEGNKAIGLYPITNLSIVSQNIESLNIDVDIATKWTKLLEFCGTGTGDRQCFDLENQVDGDFITVHWDHETQRTYHPQTFWNFFENFLMDKMV
jgi:hypothetical protein